MRDSTIDAAIAAVREEIQEDTRSAPTALHPILDTLSERLLATSLSAADFREAVPGGWRAAARLFCDHFGETPRSYLRRRRVQLATRLLDDTTLPLFRIAKSSGFSSLSALSHAFRKIHGQSPSHWQRPANPASDRTHDDRNIEPSADTLITSLRSALNSTLQFSDVELLAKQLLSRSTLQTGPSSLSPIALRPARPNLAADLEHIKAQSLWALLAPLSHETRIQTLRQAGTFSTPALYDLLVSKSRIRGRSSRTDGVCLAELALLSLDQIRSSMIDDRVRVELKAKANAWLGHAHTLAHDLRAATLAFARVDSYEPVSGFSAATRAELLCTRADYCRYSRRLDDAEALLAEAINLWRNLCSPEWLCRALGQLGLTLYDAGRTAAAIPVLAEASDLGQTLEDAHLKYACHHNLAAAHLAAGYPKRADQLLSAMPRSYGRDIPTLQTRWLKSLIAEELGQPGLAQAGLEEVHRELLDAGALGYAGVSGLDLAIIACKAGSAKTATTVLANTITAFKLLGDTRNANACTVLLERIQQAPKFLLSTLLTARQELAASQLGVPQRSRH